MRNSSKTIEEFVSDVLCDVDIVRKCKRKFSCTKEGLEVILKSSLQRICSLISRVPNYYEKEYEACRDRFGVHVNLRICPEQCNRFSLFGSLHVESDGRVYKWVNDYDVVEFVEWVLNNDLLNIVDQIAFTAVLDQEMYKSRCADLVGKFTQLPLPCKVVFEKKFHNTGKPLKVVVEEMTREGYATNDIVKAMMDVLAGVTWDD